MDVSGDGLDPHDCTEAYDTVAAGMGIWAAAHPSESGAIAAAAALATHLVGQAVCDPNTNLGPPPSYIDDKLGYDPAHEAAPSFEMPSEPADTTDSFDYGAASSDLSGGFDYSGASGSGLD